MSRMRHQRRVRRRRQQRHANAPEVLENRTLLAATIQENFRVPNARTAFDDLADSADLLAYNYLDAETNFPLVVAPQGQLDVDGRVPLVPRNGSSPTPTVDSDEHFQGIARSFGTGTPYFYESDSGSVGGDHEHRANLLIAKIGSASVDGERLGTNRFTERVDNASQSPYGNPPPEDRIVNNILFEDYGHLGGLSMSGEILAVSLERPLDPDRGYLPTVDPNKPRGLVQFFDTSNPANPRLIPNVDIIPPFGTNDGGEVGVLALTRMDDGTFLMALSAKDGIDVVFYRSNGPDFFAPGFSFGPMQQEIGALYETTRPFDVLRADRGAIDSRTGTIGSLRTPWPHNYSKFGSSIPNAHQNLTFITETDGDLYLIGSRNDCGGSHALCPGSAPPIFDPDNPDDMLDLYKVTSQSNVSDPQLGEVTLQLIASREVETKEGHFAHVGGGHVTPTGELLYYSGDGYNNDDNHRVDVGELRSKTLATTDGAIRGIVATTPDGMFSKTTRDGSAEFLEAGNVATTTSNGETIFSVEAGKAIRFDASVLQGWVEFYDESSARENQLLVEIDDADESQVLFDFKKANDTGNSEFNDDAEQISYWLPRGTRVTLYEDGVTDTNQSKLARYQAPSLVNPLANDVVGRIDIEDDVRDEVTAMQFFRAGQFPGPSGFYFPNFETLTSDHPRFEWTSVAQSGTTTPIQDRYPSDARDDQKLSVRFDGTGRQEIVLRYLPAGGLIRDTPASVLLAEGFGVPLGTTVKSDWAELRIVADVLPAVGNEPPEADPGGEYFVLEGSSIMLDGSGSSDPDQPNDSLTYEWDLDEDSREGETGADAERGDEVGMRPVFSAEGLDDDAVPILLYVTDDEGRDDKNQTRLTVVNADPVITNLTDHLYGVARFAGDSIQIDASFMDPGILDTHTATIDWGDGTTTNAAVTETDGAGSAMGSHEYNEDGTYEVTVTVEDDDGGEVSETTHVIVGGAGIVDGVLYVQGSDSRDNLKLKHDTRKNLIKVDAKLNQGREQTRLRPTFPTDGIDHVVVYLGDSNDIAKWTGRESFPTELHAGRGRDKIKGSQADDTIFGGGGDDSIRGGNGNDIILGGDGADTLKGDNGRDVLIGGAGVNSLSGGKNADLLMSYSVGEDLDVLNAIAAEWWSENSYEERVDNLRNGTGTPGGGANGSVYIPSVVVADAESDALKGNQGRDYFWALESEVADLFDNELRDEVL